MHHLPIYPFETYSLGVSQWASCISRRGLDLTQDVLGDSESHVSRGVFWTSLKMSQGPMCPMYLEGLFGPRWRCLKGRWASCTSRTVLDLARDVSRDMSPMYLEGSSGPRSRCLRGRCAPCILRVVLDLARDVSGADDPHVSRGAFWTLLKMSQGLMNPMYLKGHFGPRSRCLKGQWALCISRGNLDLPRDGLGANAPHVAWGVS